METYKRVLEKDLTKFTIDVLKFLGASEYRAKLTAKVLVGSDLRGYKVTVLQVELAF